MSLFVAWLGMKFFCRFLQFLRVLNRKRRSGLFLVEWTRQFEILLILWLLVVGKQMVGPWKDHPIFIGHELQLLHKINTISTVLCWHFCWPHCTTWQSQKLALWYLNPVTLWKRNWSGSLVGQNFIKLEEGNVITESQWCFQSCFELGEERNQSGTLVTKMLMGSVNLKGKISISSLNIILVFQCIIKEISDKTESKKEVSMLNK